VKRLFRGSLRISSWFLLSGLAVSCAAADEHDSAELADQSSALTGEDGLALAFGRFKQEFVTLGRDRAFDIGLGPFPQLGTEQLGRAPLVLDFEQSGDIFTGAFSVRTEAGFELPSELAYDLWAGRNVEGAGRSMRPEQGDELTFLGTISAQTREFFSANVNFRDFSSIDFLLLTREGVAPEQSVVALANLSLFEKRYFAEQFGWTLPSAQGVPSAAVPTDDPLIERGFSVFFSETFAGNGRTCGSCHRAENNFTIDPAFVATLSPDDPLLAAGRNVPGLEGDQASDPLGLMREKGLILENLDGPAPAGHVFRSVQHTLGLAATTTRARVSILDGQTVEGPPDERTGWSGDGSPGRGTLHDFAVGAISQHLTNDVARRSGVDFRLPTQAELDALEAFQLSLGRSKELDVRALTFREQAAENGKTLFNSQGLCFVCHNNGGARSQGPAIFNNVNLDQGVEQRPETLALGLPPDAGFGKAPKFDENGTFRGFGTGEFNVQTLIEAADTPPFFHNNSAATLEDAVRHYTTDAFDPVLAGFSAETRPTLDEQQVQDVAAFLRVLNAAENVRQVRQRLEYVRDHRSARNDALLQLALADVRDAVEVLAQPNRPLANDLHHALKTVEQLVLQLIAHPDSARAAYADIALTWCNQAVSGAFSANPNGEFLSD
jgi:cytochrome c peroxidase